MNKQINTSFIFNFFFLNFDIQNISFVDQTKIINKLLYSFFLFFIVLFNYKTEEIAYTKTYFYINKLKIILIMIIFWAFICIAFNSIFTIIIVFIIIIKIDNIIIWIHFLLYLIILH